MAIWAPFGHRIALFVLVTALCYKCCDFLLTTFPLRRNVTVTFEQGMSSLKAMAPHRFPLISCEYVEVPSRCPVGLVRPRPTQ